MSITILLAALLHAGIAFWSSPPESVPPVKRDQPLKINLLAIVAETTTNVSSKVPPPQKIIEQKIQRKVVKPAMPKKPIPKPEKVKPQQIKNISGPDLEPEPMSEPTPAPPVENSPVAIDAVATARYEQLLVAWLEKHKKYPRRAKRLRIEGEGMLRILINRNGQTQQVNLQQRTGNRLLDKAALEMAQRANPFPPMPLNDPRAQLEFVVPVAFVLR